MQNSGSLQDLLASLDLTVTSAYVLVFSPEVEWQPIIIIIIRRMSRKCDDQSRQRHQQILSACHIRICVHLVEVNLLYNHILVSLPALIFWTFATDDTDTHCALYTLTVCLYCEMSNQASDFLWPMPKAIYGGTCNYLLNTQHWENSLLGAWMVDKTKKEWGFITNASFPHLHANAGQTMIFVGDWNSFPS